MPIKSVDVKEIASPMNDGHQLLPRHIRRSASIWVPQSVSIYWLKGGLALIVEG
jgi:hypothetical protein